MESGLTGGVLEDQEVRKPAKYGGIKETVLYILALPLYMLAKFWPKNPRLNLFGSCHGLHMADNTKYLFLYASRNCPEAECVFMSRNESAVEELTRAGYSAKYTFSWDGIKAAVRARRCFISHSTNDIHPLLVGGAEKIMLWHGTPLKKICYDVNLKAGGWRRWLKYTLRETTFKLFPYLKRSTRFAKLVIPSEGVRAVFRSAFRHPDKDILVLGYARNDCFDPEYQLDPKLFTELPQLEEWQKRYDTVISWLPTHRLFSGHTLMELMKDHDYDQAALDAVLAKHNTLFVIKAHFLDYRGAHGRFQNHPNIHVYQAMDPYPLLRYSDILVTDYSSVYMDYLNADRPILFAPFDYDQYIREEVPLYRDYDSCTPGPKGHTWPEFIKILDQTLSDLREGKPDPYAAERSEANKLYNSFPGGNAARIMAHFLKDSRP